MKFLICGSGHSIRQVDGWDTSTHRVVAVNNAWKVIDWDHFACTKDYEKDYNRSVGFPQVSEKDVKTQRWWDQRTIIDSANKYGGQWQVGQSVTLTAAYTVLRLFGEQCEQVGFIGCDMVYPPGKTAYYGTGIDFEKRKMSDPDHMGEHAQKNNVSLEGKPAGDMTPGEILTHYYERFERIANEHNVRVVNYSTEESRLPYERETYV